MKLKLPLSSISNEVQFLRSAGYSFHDDIKTGNESWVRRLGSNFYPRFHLYIHKVSNIIVFDLHLDHKKPSYKGSHAHAGEYDGPLVEGELKRLEAMTVSHPPTLAGVPPADSVRTLRPRRWFGTFF